LTILVLTRFNIVGFSSSFVVDGCDALGTGNAEEDDDLGNAEEDDDDAEEDDGSSDC
jgi:hypothetical protein